MALVWRIISNLIVLALLAVAGYLFYMLVLINASTPIPESPQGTLSIPTATAPANPAPVVEAPAADPAPVADPAPIVAAPVADPAPVVEAPIADPAPAPTP